MGLACETLACTRARPLPGFPPADAVVATEIFEHLHDPLPALERLAAALRPGGAMLTTGGDHEEELLHVSPGPGPRRSAPAPRGHGALDRSPAAGARRVRRQGIKTG